MVYFLHKSLQKTVYIVIALLVFQMVAISSHDESSHDEFSHDGLSSLECFYCVSIDTQDEWERAKPPHPVFSPLSDSTIFGRLILRLSRHDFFIPQSRAPPVIR